MDGFIIDLRARIVEPFTRAGTSARRPRRLPAAASPQGIQPP